MITAIHTHDLAATWAELEAKGAVFATPITEQGWGLCTSLDVPGTDPIMLYQPRHPIAFDLPGRGRGSGC